MKRATFVVALLYSFALSKVAMFTIQMDESSAKAILE